MMAFSKLFSNPATLAELAFDLIFTKMRCWCRRVRPVRSPSITFQNQEPIQFKSLELVLQIVQAPSLFPGWLRSIHCRLQPIQLEEELFVVEILRRISNGH